MDDEPVFPHVDAVRSIVSPASREVHVRAVRHLARTTGAQFIDDAGLDGIAPGSVTTIAAIELCLAGWWRRLDGGYVIADVIADRDPIDAMSRGRTWRRVGAVCRRVWKALNSEKFIPL
jgi:hypothetical protein